MEYPTLRRAWLCFWILILGNGAASPAMSGGACLADTPLAAAATPATIEELADHLAPLWSILRGQESEFRLDFEGSLPIDGGNQPLRGSLRRYSNEAFDLTLEHPDYAIEIRRRPQSTAFALPKHRVIFLGEGELHTPDHLRPDAVLSRLLSPGSTVTAIAQMTTAGDAVSTLRLASALANLRYSPEENAWQILGKGLIRTLGEDDRTALSIDIDDVKFSLSVHKHPLGEPTPTSFWPEYRVEAIDRNELETTLCRGVRRALEVLQPGPELIAPRQVPRKVPHGELRFREGQRLVLLTGTPEEIGTAHGQLLPEESQRCIDSVLYAFGTAQTIVNGRWFRQDLEDAYKRLQPHIPLHHIAETRALAKALGQDPHVLEILNVFPELFHCSGFALFGTATVDGKLFHGRVLDYMTTIGLQDCATTFIINPEGKYAFANVGYAAFTGSVSGMNDQGISLGEMGGRGEGQWDGVPMATLMRRGLEECATLQQVQELWKANPRTCEYYYVFADGNANTAVGVAATPEKVEFVHPGEGHPLLGDGITDSVVLSAGSRLATLRERVQSSHGKIDVEKAIWLMSRPVAMQSNLHNVLFIPADRVMHVANADHDRPAADCHYVRYDLRKLLRDVEGLASSHVSAALPRE